VYGSELMKKVIAIIPARGGSKRVPKKNIKYLNGKPLIAYSIEQSLGCKEISRTIVSTDSKEIAGISRRYGADVIMRSKELATDKSSSLDVLKHLVFVLEEENYDFDSVIMLQPTSPLRSSNLLSKAINKFMKSNSDMMISVKKADMPSNWFLRIEKDELKFISKNDFSKIRKQDQKDNAIYLINGSVYIFNKELIMNSENYVWGDRVTPLVMSSHESLDIDEEIDFKIAESLIEKEDLPEIKIGNKTIDNNSPCFMIAEAGVNHNGDLEIAKKLIDVAADAGVDAVKFQTFKAEKLVTKDADQAEYQKKNIGKQETQFEMLKRLELKEEYHQILKEYAEKKGLIFLSTPFDEDSIDFLDELGVVAFKAGSGEVNNIPYLVKMAKKNKPIILATGMSTMEDVKEAYESMKSQGNNNIVILHCTTNYPTPYEEVNLRAMETMRKELECLVGYSDHTEGIVVPLVAASMGAVVIEKHFTLDRNMEGPDHKASLEPKELKEMVKQIRLVEIIRGSEEKKSTDSEKRIEVVAKKSLVAKQDIAKGTVITSDMIIIKRPGTGIPPQDISKVLGKIAKKNIAKDKLILWNDLK